MWSDFYENTICQHFYFLFLWMWEVKNLPQDAVEIAAPKSITQKWSSGIFWILDDSGNISQKSDTTWRSWLAKEQKIQASMVISKCLLKIEHRVWSVAVDYFGFNVKTFKIRKINLSDKHPPLQDMPYFVNKLAYYWLDYFCERIWKNCIFFPEALFCFLGCRGKRNETLK